MSQRKAAPCLVRRLGLVAYDEAQSEQQRVVDTVREGEQPQLLLLQHTPTYTLGARAQPEHLLLDDAALERLGAAVRRVDRGGDVTFHGPGQLVGYPILDLKRWGQGPLWYVRLLEAALIETVSAFGIDAHREQGKRGVWTSGAKIASIGIHVSRGITSHGFALNVNPDMAWFSHMVPCGLADVRMTSMALELGAAPDIDSVMDSFVAAFGRVFQIELQDGGRTITPPAWTPAAAL